MHYHMGYNHKFGMVGDIYGSEITVIFKNKTKKNPPVLILHFSISTMLKMTYNFRNCKVAFLDCYKVDVINS